MRRFNSSFLIIGLFIFVSLLLLAPAIKSAKFCYSGQNSRFAQKHCNFLFIQFN
jgi:hypothetical protein